jgi:hypothetical protein
VVTVIVDAENVRRSLWPNIGERRLVELVRAWAAREGVRALLVFDRRAPVDDDDVVGTAGESADDWIARAAAELEEPYWLVTSDRELRRRAGARAERILGGGKFLRELGLD